MLEQSRVGPTGCFVAALLGAAAAFLAAPAAAQPEIFPTLGVTWTVQPKFGRNGEGRDNVSGATCMSIPPIARAPCLVVNDSTRFAQLFSVSGTTIRSGLFVGVTAAAPAGTLTFNPNMEGAAHDDRFFYVVTSRGLAGSIAQPDTAFLVARFAPEAATPAAPVPFASGTTAAGIQTSDRIRTALTSGIAVPGLLPSQRLDRTNAAIEGIAVKDRATARGTERMLHLGFRAPVLGGKAFIVSALVNNVFAASGPLNPTVTALALGEGNIGIRDLAAVSDGILILAGPGRGVTGRASLFHWSDTTGQLKQLGIIVDATNRNGETLLVLQEDPEFVRFLVMFDGVENGGPVEYFVPR